MKNFLLFFAFAFTACNSQQTSSTKKDSVDTNNSAAQIAINNLTGKHCYAYTKNKDSILLSIEIDDSNVSGDLTYNLYGKDKNKGTITGKMMNDTLLADYTFFSEGTQSVRQVSFLLDESTAKEGHGAMNENNNRLLFTNPRQLIFDTTFVLQKQACKN